MQRGEEIRWGSYKGSGTDGEKEPVQQVEANTKDNQIEVEINARSS